MTTSRNVIAIIIVSYGIERFSFLSDKDEIPFFSGACNFTTYFLYVYKARKDFGLGGGFSMKVASFNL
jgi:hypothetical protein